MGTNWRQVATDKLTVDDQNCLPRSVVAPSLDDTVNYSRLNIQLSPTNMSSDSRNSSTTLGVSVVGVMSSTGHFTELPKM
ncbi:hypothetical protein TYRP_015936 [Tyrophagus putrescentiae]|nr:hypothetical protein TYRP_015936 [Tyrophagus putrescentiae]